MLHDRVNHGVEKHGTTMLFDTSGRPFFGPLICTRSLVHTGRGRAAVNTGGKMHNCVPGRAHEARKRVV